MGSRTTDSRTALVEDLLDRFPHLPREAVFKEDLLRGGVAFDESALSDTANEASGDAKAAPGKEVVLRNALA